MGERVEDTGVADVISMQDWVPGWVKDAYLTEGEIDAFNQEFNQSRSQPNQEPPPAALLVEKAAAKLESIDRSSLEKWLHRIPPELLIELIEKSDK